MPHDSEKPEKHHNGISITEWLAKNNKKYTEKNFDEYFKEYKGISRADVMEEIAAACMGKVMGTNGFIKEHGGNVKLVQRAFYGLRKLARALMNRQVQIGEDSDGFTLAFRDVLAYKRLYEVAFFKTAYGISGVDLDELAEKLEARDEADKDAIPDMSKRVKEMEKEEKLETKRALGTRYSLSVDDKKIAEIKMTASEREAGEEIADFIEEVNGMKDQSKIAKRKKRVGKPSEKHRNIIEIIMRTVYPDFSAEGYVIWIDGIAAKHIERRHGSNGKKDRTMAGMDAKKIIPWAVQNAENGDFIYEKGEIKKSDRFDNQDQTPALEIRLEKTLAEGIVYVSECVPDSKAKIIWITSAYRETKKGSKGQLMNMEEESSLHLTPEAPDDGNATIDMIAQPSEKVNPKTTKKSLPAKDVAEGGQRTKKDLSPEDAKAREEFLSEVDRIEREQAAFMNDEQKKASGDVLEFLAERGITGKGTEAHGSIAVAAEEPKEEQTETPARKPGRLKAYTLDYLKNEPA